MNQSVQALLGLVLGLALGLIARASGSDAFIGGVEMLRPVGQFWLNLLLMTLVPLVFALVAGGIIRLDAEGGGARLLRTTLPLMVGMLLFAAACGVMLALLFDQVWPVARGALSDYRLADAGAGGEPPAFTDMIVGLVPTNVVQAAAEGNMAALVVFALIFGLAVARTERGKAPVLSDLVTRLGEVMMRIVHWILLFAPIGIFALVASVTVQMGVAMAAVMAQLVTYQISGSVLAIILSYVLAALIGGVSPLRFARAALAPQATAAGTSSSTACLPVMIEASEERLDVDPAIAGSVLPLAVSIFRFSTALMGGAVLVVLLLATGQELDIGKLAIAAFLLVLGNMGAAGVPGAAVGVAIWAAAYKFLGLDIELLAIYLAVNALPDLIETVGNVSADLSLTTIVSRLLGKPQGA